MKLFHGYIWGKETNDNCGVVQKSRGHAKGIENSSVFSILASVPIFLFCLTEAESIFEKHEKP